MKHISFPDIGQFRNVIRNVTSHAQYVGKDDNGDPIYDPLKPLPTLQFEGTVKLHGTNAAVCKNFITGEVWFQSRERIITVDDDNAGFARFMSDKTEILDRLFYQSAVGYNGGTVSIYGEWCGQGIQKGVGISTLPKMFVIFAVQVNGEWLSKSAVSFLRETVLDHYPNSNIYNIYSFPTWGAIIDFKNPVLSQNALQEFTLAVENECPVSKFFGQPGIGEGIVWRCITPGWEDPKFWMKVKGEKHSVSKVKTLASVDIELVKNQTEFVNNTVTDARCLQSISKLREAGKVTDRTCLGEFIRWIYNDIIKEETDTAKANGLEIEKMGGPIAKAAKTWFFTNENSL